ncbi:MAG: radical SAM protein [Nitrospirae bacterium]|nr:MAG: radical SAM protein [Nitrospirota bacterium]
MPYVGTKQPASYRALLRNGELYTRVEHARLALQSCRVCPRHCAVNRLAGELGTCLVGAKALVASAHPHFGEEFPIRGWFGSGTIFFAGCNLRCLYCQNHDISHAPNGQELESDELAALMLALQEQGCHNINLVSPSHQVPQILEGILVAAQRGLRLPIVYNTSSYDDLEMLRLLEGVVDIYMPDFKYADAVIGRRLSKIPDYPSRAQAALKEMHRQVGDLVLDEDGIAVRGLLVRHLVLPENLAGTEEVMRFLAHEISRDTYVHIMDQYYPAAKASRHPVLNRRVRTYEVEAAIAQARACGLYRLHEE